MAVRQYTQILVDHSSQDLFYLKVCKIACALKCWIIRLNIINLLLIVEASVMTYLFNNGLLTVMFRN